MNVLYNTVRNRKKHKRLSSEGIQKYFLKILLIFFELYIVLFSFIAAIPLVLVPSVVIADRAVLNGNPNIFTVFLIPAATYIIIFTVLLFIINSFVFRFPSSFFFNTKPIEKSKIVMNTVYWRNFGKNAVFLASLLMGEYIIFNINNSIGEFFASFIFHTVFLYFYSVFIFYTFYDILQDLNQ